MELVSVDLQSAPDPLNPDVRLGLIPWLWTAVPSIAAAGGGAASAETLWKYSVCAVAAVVV
jgi:hypothetical protein